MDGKNKEVEPRCQHLVLDECSQNHYNNCAGLRQCILYMEQQNIALKEKLKVAVEALRFIKVKYEPYIAYLQVTEDVSKALTQIGEIE